MVVPDWAQELFRAKGIEHVVRAEVVKDTAFHKLVIGYTPTTAILAEKSLLGSAAYLLPLGAPRVLPAEVPLAAPLVETPKRGKAKRKAEPKRKAPRGEVRPRPRKPRAAPEAVPDAMPDAAPAMAPEAGPLEAPAAPAAPPVEPLALDETRSFDAPPAPAPGAEPHREGDFTLHAREQHGRPFYFFARGPPRSGSPAAMPEGYEVAWNEKTRTPFLRRKR